MAVHKQINTNGAIDENGVVKKQPLKCESQEQPVPPDGGWGWVVVFASFMIHVVSKYSVVFVSHENLCQKFALYFFFVNHLNLR